MFRVDWIERYLSRVRPWHVAAFWVPAVLWLLFRAVRNERLGLGADLALLAGGVLAWTFLEYVLHRWVFHFRPSEASEWQRDLSFLIHGVHHDYPYDPDRLVMPPVISGIIAVAVGLPLHALVGSDAFDAAFAGLVAGYLWYDLTHYAVHHLPQHTAFGRLQRRNHYVHHFKRPEQLFGVTTPLWDLVFRTYPPMGKGETADAPAR